MERGKDFVDSPENWKLRGLLALLILLANSCT